MFSNSFLSLRILKPDECLFFLMALGLPSEGGLENLPFLMPGLWVGVLGPVWLFIFLTRLLRRPKSEFEKELSFKELVEPVKLILSEDDETLFFFSFYEFFEDSPFSFLLSRRRSLILSSYFSFCARFLVFYLCNWFWVLCGFMPTLEGKREIYLFKVPFYTIELLRDAFEWLTFPLLIPLCLLLACDFMFDFPPLDALLLLLPDSRFSERVDYLLMRKLAIYKPRDTLLKDWCLRLGVDLPEFVIGVISMSDYILLFLVVYFFLTS